MQLNQTIDATSMLNNILHTQSHRGPDFSDAWWDQRERVGLCHNRLSILDLSSLANQPIHDTKQLFSLVFNGEIYNWKDIRKELEALGSNFRTHSDTEVILEGFIRWGHDLLTRLRGMFAFAIYNKNNRELFLARDRIGKKPLIYAENNTGFVFASEIPALTDWPGLNKSIDHNALGAMLLHNLRHIPEPCTVYRGLRRLRPGHAMVVKDGKIQKKWRYWTPISRSVKSPQELLSILKEAVEIRSFADVPVGALLSGGIDSTAIVHLMQKLRHEPVKTYAFGANQGDEDLRRARYMAAKLGTDHKEYYFDAGRQFEVLKKILHVYGEPIMLLPLIHAYELSEQVRDDGIKVVLNGNGADELFYGYTGHLNTARMTRVMNSIGWLRSVIPVRKGKLGVFFAKPGNRKSRMYTLKANQRWPCIFQENAIKNMNNVVADEMREWGQLLPHNDFIDESNYLSLLIENSHSLTIASDLPAMMASVEMRSPFLDQEIVSAAMGIHFSKKVKGSKDGSRLKNILRQSVKDLMPAEILNAPKRGFGMGIQERDLLLGEWKQSAERIFSDLDEFDGLFNSTWIRKYWRYFSDTGRGDVSLIAKLFAIQLWSRERYSN